MGFLFGLVLPAEKIPPLILGPAVALIGLVVGYMEVRSPGQVSLWWCAADVVLGLALTVHGLKERRKRSSGVGTGDCDNE
jgi:hypothetical protein